MAIVSVNDPGMTMKGQVVYTDPLQGAMPNFTPFLPCD